MILLMYVYRDKRYIQPKFWGLTFWNYMFMYSKHYEKNEMRTPLKHFKTLSFFIPCNKCRKEFRTELTRNPPPKDKNKLFEWIWKFKNKVNKRQREYLNMNKKDISLKQAKKNQSRLSDFSVISLFFKKLFLTMPTLTRSHPFRARVRYKSNRVHENYRKLIQDLVGIG